MKYINKPTPKTEECCGCGKCNTKQSGVSIKDNLDGSGTATFTIPYEDIIAFARLGIEIAIKDAIKDANRLKPIECGFADVDVKCDTCTCWKIDSDDNP